MSILALPNDVIIEIVIQEPSILPVLSRTCKQFNTLMQSRRLMFMLFRARFPIKKMIGLPKSEYVRITFGDEFITLARNYTYHIKVWIYERNKSMFFEVNPCEQIFIITNGVFSFKQAYMIHTREQIEKDNEILQMAYEIIGGYS